jgi:hypothetical protein
VLENAGLTTRIIERRAGSDFRAAQGERHVALLGVDNLLTRRLTSGAGWTLAINTGLGDQPGNFDSILIHRFPGSRRSDEIPAWQPREPRAVAIPQTAAAATDSPVRTSTPRRRSTRSAVLDNRGSSPSSTRGARSSSSHRISWPVRPGSCLASRVVSNWPCAVTSVPG